MNEEIRLVGELIDIIYQNDQNAYTVCEIETDEGLVTCVGYLPYISQGEQLSLLGEWTVHPEYGEQFRVQTFEKILPTTVQSILLYLSSGIIHGVKEATAKKIVDKFGEDSLHIILTDWQKLAQIRGISIARANDIHVSFVERQSVQNTVMFLQNYGVTADFAMKVHRHFGAESVEKIKKNPYVLCEEIAGIGFRTADRIAAEMGMEPTHPGRIQSGLKYTLSEATSSGHTYLPKNLLFARATEILKVEEHLLQDEYTTLLFEGHIYEESDEEDPHVYLLPYKNAEVGIAARLHELIKEKPLCPPEVFDSLAKEAAKRAGITLSSEQMRAVECAFSNSVFIITGGPGTGKTTIINCLLSIADHLNLDVSLAAPTGRAAKRMSECTGHEAATIHRLLEVDFSSEHSLHFMRNEHEPLPIDMLIVDEMSMVDTLLFHALLKACRNGIRLILVGDADQLPSVGAGNVLADLIESGQIPVCNLTTIYRQAAESMIVQNAHRINRGEPLLMNQKDNDFFFLERKSPEEIVETVCSLCERRLPNSYHCDPMTDIQVLCPMRKTAAGVYALNKALQSCLNPPSSRKEELIFRDTVFRIGDKVMQISNNYNLYWKKEDGEDGLGIFNGDVGVITHIDRHDKLLTVLFDSERTVTYDSTQLDELELAYAVTVHKSQGSEFPMTIIVLGSTPHQLIRRNLFYTAVSRAKELVVLVGRKEVANAMIENTGVQKRYTGLKKILKGRNRL